MISARRAHELVDLFTQMRKQACVEVAPPVREFFAEQERQARSLRPEKLAEIHQASPEILQHLVTP